MGQLVPIAKKCWQKHGGGYLQSWSIEVRRGNVIVVVIAKVWPSASPKMAGNNWKCRWESASHQRPLRPRRRSVSVSNKRSWWGEATRMVNFAEGHLPHRKWTKRWRRRWWIVIKTQLLVAIVAVLMATVGMDRSPAAMWSRPYWYSGWRRTGVSQAASQSGYSTKVKIIQNCGKSLKISGWN